jgi:hypothetical protein
MKTILTTVLMICLVTSLVNSQTIKVTGGANLMRINSAFDSSTFDIPMMMIQVYQQGRLF